MTGDSLICEYPTDIEKCILWIKEHSYQKVCLQFPDELMHQSVEISLALKKELLIKTFIIGDPTLENCCVNNITAQHIQADAMIHFGHACLSTNYHLPTFYVFPKKQCNIEHFLESFQNTFIDKMQTIILFYDVAYTHVMQEIYEYLQKHYQNLVLSKLNCHSNINYVSKISDDTIGRYVPSIIDKFDLSIAVFLGTNEKTLAVLSTSYQFKKCLYYDGISLLEYNFQNTIYFKRKYFLIEKIKDANTFGILINSFNVQDILKITKKLQFILREVKKKFYIITVGKISPEKLANFNEIDVFILVSCAEMTIEQYKDFHKPIVIPFEIENAFNSLRTYDSFHALDFKQILPGGKGYCEFTPNADPDVSLVSGNIRHTQDTVSDSTEISIISNIVNLHSRQWYGLDQEERGKQINKIEEGRDGIPINYKNEMYK